MDKKILVGIVVFVGMVFVFLRHRRVERYVPNEVVPNEVVPIVNVPIVNVPEGNFGSCTSGCGSAGQGSAGQGSAEKLLPIMESAFNLRECAKQLILLEDHLNNPEKQCRDCICKHLLSIEGLAEEGCSINGSQEEKEECIKLAHQTRECSKKFINGVDPQEIAMELRQIRKPLMSRYFYAV